VERDGAVLARCTGLIDRAGRPVRGLAPEVVSGASCDAAAAWRGAFLAQGSLSEPRGSSALQVDAPGPEAALALVGAARVLSPSPGRYTAASGSWSATVTRSSPC